MAQAAPPASTVRVGAPHGAADTTAEVEGDSSSTFDFEDFFEHAAVALHLLGPDGTILHANQAELELLGYLSEEYIGQKFSSFHLDPEAAGDMLARLRRGEKLKKYPARLRAGDGSTRHVEISSSGRFRNGIFVGSRCSMVDVTPAVSPFGTEDALPVGDGQNEDQRLRALLDVLPAAVYATDAQGMITYFNRAAAEFAGREPGIGEDYWCVTHRLFTTEGVELLHEECPMAVCLKEGRPVRGVEAVAQRPDGSLHPFLPFPTPIHDREGRLVGAVNLLVDISDRKQAENNLRVVVDELNHRVKNNLQMLCALLQAARRDTRSEEASAVLAAAGQRVAAMAAAQKQLYGDGNPTEFEVSCFLEAVCDSVRQTMGVDIAIEGLVEGSRLPNPIAMPLALVLNELLTNAATHGLGGRDEGAIRVTFVREPGQVMLSVEDDGPGFEPHDTGRRSSGLGLVRGLARQLRSTFEVEEGKGARCILRIPDSSPL